MIKLRMVKKYAPAGMPAKFTYNLKGVKSEGFTGSSNIYQHPVDAKKQTLTDDITQEALPYTVVMFIPDNSQDIFVSGSGFTTPDLTIRHSQQVFNDLDSYRKKGIVWDIDRTSAGLLQNMVIESISGSRDLRAGLEITLQFKEIMFADSSSTTEVVTSPNTSVAKKTQPKDTKGKADTQAQTAKQSETPLLSLGKMLGGAL